MASAPLNWLLKIGGATLKTTAKTLSEAVNTLHDTVTNLSTTVTNLGTTVTNLGTSVTNLGTSKADASTTTTALNNLETNKLNISDLLSLEEIEASTSLTGKGVTAESIKSLNNSLTANSNKFYFDYQDGKYGFNTDPNRGADTFSPFSSGVNEIAFGWNGSNYGAGIIKKDGTTIGGSVYGTTLNGNYISLNIGTQYKEGTIYKGSITFTALVAGNYQIYENGTVTDKSVSANEVIYTKTMAGNNIPVSVVAI